MPHHQSSTTAGRRIRSTVFASVAIIAVILLGRTLLPSLATPTTDGDGGSLAVGVDDGKLPGRVTVSEDEYPGVAGLDPALLDALRRAASDAAGEGVEFYVNSGWRSRDYQRQLLDQAVSEYGSRAEAARWVATPATSPHVAGDAVDLGPYAAEAWLTAHGSAYGLCQIYVNEPWHFELRPAAATDGCPAPYADPTRDPRMRR